MTHTGTTEALTVFWSSTIESISTISEAEFKGEQVIRIPLQILSVEENLAEVTQDKYLMGSALKHYRNTSSPQVVVSQRTH